MLGVWLKPDSSSINYTGMFPFSFASKVSPSKDDLSIRVKDSRVSLFLGDRNSNRFGTYYCNMVSGFGII